MKKRMSWKWGTTIAVMLMLVLALGACTQSAPAPAPSPSPAPAPAPSTGPIELKAVSFLPVDFQENEAYKYFIDTVRQKSNGELTIKLMGGPEAIPGQEQPEAARSGVVDITMIPQPYYVSIVPEIAVQQLMEISAKEARANGLFDLLNQAHMKQNLVYVGPLGNSSGFYLFTRNKITSTAGLKGVKMRGGPNYAPLMNAMGISQVTMPIGDVYTALEQGVVDGLAIVLPEVKARKLYEQVKFCIDHPFLRGLALMVIMNLDKYNSLPPNLQQVILDAGVDMATYAEQNVPVIEGGARQFLETEAGMEFVKFAPDDAKYFLDAADQGGYNDLKQRAPEMADKLWALSRKK